MLLFKLFPIGYGPTPSKRKDIVLKQEVGISKMKPWHPWEGTLPKSDWN